MTTIRSFSKINLGLEIGPVREDGFHSLASVYQTLELHDLVTVETSRSSVTSISLTANHPRVPSDASNTAWRMADLMLGETGKTARIQIHIEKRLPVEGGLGAGSANAAATLFALERELGVQLSDSARMRLAAAVGSDVPLFISGGMTYGSGRGEVITELPDSPPLACAIALPGIGVSTTRAFEEWDHSLTVRSAPRKIDKLSGLVAELFTANPVSGAFRWKDLAESPLLALVRTGIENDFEQVVFPQYPLLGKIKHALDGSSGNGNNMPPAESKSCCLYAALSGSGSAVFGLYRTVAEAEQAVRRVEELGVDSVVTRTLPRSDYQASMEASGAQ